MFFLNLAIRLALLLIVLSLISCASPDAPEVTSQGAKASEYTIFPELNIGNTGMTFDSKLGLIVHARYDYETSSKLIFTDLSANPVDELDVTSLIDHIQGLAYNKDNDSFWIWGTKKGVTHEPFTSAQELIEVSRSGALLNSLTPQDEMNYPGMIEYGGQSRLWVKANTKTMLYLIDTTSGDILDQIETGLGGEGFAFDSEGSLWVHDGSIIRKMNLNGQTVLDINSPVYCANSEGLTFDNQGHLWVAADEGLHCGIEGGNRAWRISNPGR